MAEKDHLKNDDNTTEYITSVWEFETEEQKRDMCEPITQKNCGKKLKLVREISGMSRKELAKIIGVSESTVSRLETGKTEPTKEFLLRLAGLVAIGHAKYSRMSEKDKETISQYIGTAGGVAAGVGGAIGAISVSGTVAGLSAAGITSGLAAIGGGAMLGGLAVVATIPIAAGAAGYGLVKGIKAICKANNLTCKEVNQQYEIVPEPQAEELDEEQ
ncbi:MAG: helix-turn-helix domain-containing protein [Planctomycetota bacterium]|jgi:DNA-binding XRE family transcriptional regulator